MANSNKSKTNANNNVLFEKKAIKIPTRVAGKEYQRNGKKKTEEKKSDKIENTFTSSTFPIIVIAIIGVFLLVFLYLFDTYEETFIIDADGFMISGEIDNILLGSKRKDKSNIKIENVKENEIVYKTPLNKYLIDDKKTSININYPLFINDGISIINYNESINLFDINLERTLGYKNQIFSYGKSYDTYGNEQIDNEKYILLTYSDGNLINLYDLKVKTTLYEYEIPVNSFIYFEKDKISYYERNKDEFTYKEIKDIDYKSKLTFYSESDNNEYTYESILETLGTIYIAKEKPKEDDKPHEEIKQEDNDNEKVKTDDNNKDEEEFKWVKPTVTVKDFTSNVYSLSSNISISDPSGVITNAPTFTIYMDNKIYLKRTYYSSGDISINGLVPETTFQIVGKYTYLAEDMQTKKIVTFYTNVHTTKDMSSLTPINLSLENGDIYPKKIEVKDIHVIDNYDSEAIRGISKAAIEINDTKYYLTTNQINSIINGVNTTISTSESLPSSSIIDYILNFYDRNGNILKSTNNTGSTRTSKREPTVSLKLKSNDVDKVSIVLKIKNEDNIELNNFKYSVVSSSGKIISQGLITSDTIELTELNPDQIYTIKVYSDIDINDGQGVKKEFELATMDFTSKPISSLGYINLNVKEEEITSSSVSLKYSINFRKTDKILIRLLDDLEFNLVDSNTNEIISSKKINNTQINKLKDKEELTIVFNNLESNTKYNIVIKSNVSQGEQSYNLDCLYSLESIETHKKPAEAYIINSFTTETMIDFDLGIEDEDNTIISDYVRVELRDKDNVIIESKKVPKNTKEVTRITYNNLNINEFYNIYFYADEYNETNSNINYKSKYLLQKYTYYTQEGISGNVELVSSLKESKSTNIADINSEVKWIETMQYYTIPKTVDEDGIMHIYSKSGSSSYAYDLSDYFGEIVTVSFKVKTITPVDSAFDLYFSNYISGGTGSSYSRKLEGLSTDTWKYYSYTYKVGYTYNSTNNYYEFYNADTHGKNQMSFATFYISGGTTSLAEYEIKDFEVHIQYDKKKIELGNNSLEQGRYNSNGTKPTNDTNENKYIRLTDAVYLDGGSYYSFDFDNIADYRYYVYLYKEDGKLDKGLGWFSKGGTFYVPENRYAKIMMSYRWAASKIFPEDINNIELYQYKNNNKSGYSEFEYDLVTKVRVNLQDSRDEIPTDDYYISIYDELGTEINTINYIELVDTNIVSDEIKELNLDENKTYTIELKIKIRDRFYSLSSFEITTNDEVLGISTTDDWYYLQPRGNYIVLNDIDFLNYTDQRLGWGYRYFYGTIDFQGYTMKIYSTKSDGTNADWRRINRIESSAVIKNIVLDVNINNQIVNNNLNGFIINNYGTIENVMMIIHDSHNSQTSQLYTSPLVDTNQLSGKIKNFAIKLDGDVHLYNDSSIMSRVNYGTIENGYIYGGNVIVDYNLTSGTTRTISLIQRYGGVKSSINNVYTLSSIEFPNNQSYDLSGLFAYETYGKISNSYAYGDVNYNHPEVGPIVRYPRSTSKFSNIYYMSNNIYTQENQPKSSIISLVDAEFQKSILGSGFNVDEMISLGYYPQVNYSTTRMPKQDFIELPAINEDDYADIISTSVDSQTNNEAIINVSVNNILGEEISSIQISDLDTEIISQTYENGKSQVKLRVFNPQIYVSRYQIKSISSRSSSGYTSTRKYDVGEKYLYVDLYNEIHSVSDFIKINKGLNQNYAIMSDLDFDGYTNYYINNFTGKIEGNNHTLKNINITTRGKNGLFNNMNGTLQNINFENIYINKLGSIYFGIVAYSNQYAKYYNVHIKDIVIEVPEGLTNENIRMGSLVADSSSANIDYCSATNVKITSNNNVVGIVAGGLVGMSNATSINNSFVRNLKINIDNSLSSNGTGGLIGRENSTVGTITSSYAIGNISSNSIYTGGLVGYSNGYIDNSYSSVNVSSDMGRIGGIVGNANNNTYITNTLYLGNLYTSSLTDTNIGRISANIDIATTNYAMKTGLINGKLSDLNRGETFVTYDELLKEETYENILGDAFDYSSSNKGIMPKLYSSDLKTLLPNQEDDELFINVLNINNLVMDKHADYALITLYLDNPNNYEILDVGIEDARAEITKNVNTDGITVIEFKMYPEKYLDSYKINKIIYKDNDIEKTVDKDYKLEAIFYKNLSTYDDWQKVSKTVAENYILTNDIDFTGKSKINTGVAFNRLETSTDDTTFSLKGINLEYKTNGSYNGLISKISTSIKNIGFEDITITNTSTASNNFNNIIIYNYGIMKGVKFNNITIDTPKKNFSAPVGDNFGTTIQDITVKDVTVNGKQYTSGFIARITNSLTDNVDNITGENITINASSHYTGGLFGFFLNTINNPKIRVYTNMNIKDSNITSSGNYTGGIAGYGDCNNCTVENTTVIGSQYVGGAIGQTRQYYTYDVIVKDSIVEGSTSYIGGIFGYTNNTYDSFLISSEVHGTNANTYGVGGITGYKNGWTIYRCGVLDSSISNEGSETGGLTGRLNSGNYYDSFVSNSIITGASETGGLVGKQTSSGIYYSRIMNTIVNSTESDAGGIVGHYNNDNESNGYNEGYIREVSLENVDVSSESNAGGIIGKFTEDIYYPNRIRRIYFSGSVKATDNSTYGLASGDTRNLELIGRPDVYFYERSVINDGIIKEVAQEPTLQQSNLLENVNVYSGYINGSTGLTTIDEENTSSSFTDMIKLESGKQYQININYKTSSNLFNLYFYTTDEKFISVLNSGTIESYIENYGYSTYLDTYRFRVYKDCYVRIQYSNKSSIISSTLKEVRLTNATLASSQMLSASELKERITWTQYLHDDASVWSNLYNISKLKYTKDYWDFSPVTAELGDIEVEDLSSNNISSTAKVTSTSSKGFFFDGKNNQIEIKNFSLPSDNLTISTTINSAYSRNYQYIFSSRDNVANKNGFGVLLHSQQIYVWVYNAYYNTNYYVPYNKEVNITVTYENNRYLKVYANGTLVHTRDCGNRKIINVTSAKTFIASDIQYNASTNKYLGYIKNLVIYDRVLSQDEVNSNYNSSSGVTNTNGIKLYYDFTQYSTSYNAYYPILKWNSNDYTVKNQPLTQLPDGTEEYNTNNLSLVSLNNTTLDDNYHIYSSGIDTINIEFDQISNDLSFTYKINNKEYTSKVKSRVYTLAYDYKSEAEITISNAFESKTIKLNKDELSRKISILNNKFYNIDNNTLYENNKEILTGVLHIKDNLVLTNSGKVYNINTKELQTIYSSEGILSNSIPLYSATIEDKTIETYYNFTTINNDIREDQIIINDNKMYLINSNNTLNNNIVFNNYNTNEYQIVLNKNGSLNSFKEEIKYPSSFVNKNIVEITFDKTSNEPIMIIRYSSGNVLAFNYVTGEQLYKYGTNSISTLFEYMSSEALMTTTTLKTRMSYAKTKNVVKAIETSNDSQINNMINDLVTKDNTYSNKLSEKYITSYNTSTNKYEIYNVNDILNTVIKDTEEIKDTNIIDTSNTKNTQESKITDINNKIQASNVLNNFFYGKTSSKTYKSTTKYIIYIVILLAIIINLIILSIKYGNKEVKNE
jgi:hypothetical protein